MWGRKLFAGGALRSSELAPSRCSGSLKLVAPVRHAFLNIAIIVLLLPLCVCVLMFDQLVMIFGGLRIW